MIEELYEEVVLEEGIIMTEYAILDWVKKHKKELKMAMKEMGVTEPGVISPAEMAKRFHKFLKNNPDTLSVPPVSIDRVANFLARNPDVIEEGIIMFEHAIFDWIKKHRRELKMAMREMGVIGAGVISPVVMAGYFHKFLQNNPDALSIPPSAIDRVANFLALNPNILEWIQKSSLN